MSPAGSDEPSNISLNWPICEATAIARRKPTNIAAPPSVGIAFVCTPRAFGGTIAPVRIASRRTNGVRIRVVSAATAKTTA